MLRIQTSWLLAGFFVLAAVDGKITWNSPPTQFTSVDLSNSNACSWDRAYLGAWDDVSDKEYWATLSHTPDGGFYTAYWSYEEYIYVKSTPGILLLCNATALRISCVSFYNLTVSAIDSAGSVMLTDTWSVSVTGLPADCTTTTTTTPATTTTTTPATTTKRADKSDSNESSSDPSKGRKHPKDKEGRKRDNTVANREDSWI